MSEDKKSLFNLVPDSVDNAVKNITDKPTKNMGTTLADIWYLVFGGISQAADKRKLKYSYALQEFENELKENISKIPEDKLIEPDMQIVAPALEASKYCVEKEELRHMFVNLISSSLNKNSVLYVHPLFPDIILKMSSLDAKVFLHIINYDKLDIENNAKFLTDFSKENFNPLIQSLCTLDYLGLISINIKNKHISPLLRGYNYSHDFPHYTLIDDQYHNIFKNFNGSSYNDLYAYLLKESKQNKFSPFDYIHLTPFGKIFISICL